MTDRVTALVADDEPHLARALRAEPARPWPAREIVGVAKNGVEAAERIAALAPGVAFLDIRMPGLTGLEVAQGVEGVTRVVVTANHAHAVEAFEREGIDDVLQPVSAERLARTVARVQRTLATTAGGPTGGAAGSPGNRRGPHG